MLMMPLLLYLAFHVDPVSVQSLRKQKRLTDVDRRLGGLLNFYERRAA